MIVGEQMSKYSVFRCVIFVRSNSIFLFKMSAKLHFKIKNNVFFLVTRKKAELLRQRNFKWRSAVRVFRKPQLDRTFILSRSKIIQRRNTGAENNEGSKSNPFEIAGRRRRKTVTFGQNTTIIVSPAPSLSPSTNTPTASGSPRMNKDRPLPALKPVSKRYSFLYFVLIAHSSKSIEININ